MDLRYQRLLYFLRVSRKTGRGVGYYERWHRHGSFTKPREDRYKNIDRATLRRPGSLVGRRIADHDKSHRSRGVRRRFNSDVRGGSDDDAARDPVDDP